MEWRNCGMQKTSCYRDWKIQVASLLLTLFQIRSKFGQFSPIFLHFRHICASFGTFWFHFGTDFEYFSDVFRFWTILTSFCARFGREPFRAVVCRVLTCLSLFTTLSNHTNGLSKSDFLFYYTLHYLLKRNIVHLNDWVRQEPNNCGFSAKLIVQVREKKIGKRFSFPKKFWELKRSISMCKQACCVGKIHLSERPSTSTTYCCLRKVHQRHSCQCLMQGHRISPVDL